MGFSKQEYQSGKSFFSLGDLPDPRIKPRSSALQADSLLSEPQGICNKCVQSPTSAVNIYFNSLLESKIPVLAAIFEYVWPFIFSGSVSADSTNRRSKNFF